MANTKKQESGEKAPGLTNGLEIHNVHYEPAKKLKKKEERTIHNLTTYDLLYLKGLCEKNKGKSDVDSFCYYINCVLDDDNVGQLSKRQVRLMGFYEKHCPQMVKNALELSMPVSETETEIVYKNGKHIKKVKSSDKDSELVRIMDMHDDYMANKAQIDMDDFNDEYQKMQKLKINLDEQIRIYEETIHKLETQYSEEIKRLQNFQASEKSKLMEHLKESEASIEELTKCMTVCREELRCTETELNEYKTMIGSLGFTVRKGSLMRLENGPVQIEQSEQRPEGPDPYEVYEIENSLVYETEAMPKTAELQERCEAKINQDKPDAEKHTEEFYRKLSEAKKLANIITTEPCSPATDGKEYNGTSHEEIQEVADKIKKAKECVSALSGQFTTYFSPETKDPKTPQHANDVIGMINFLREEYPGLKLSCEIGGEVIDDSTMYARAQAYLTQHKAAVPKKLKKIKKIK